MPLLTCLKIPSRISRAATLALVALTATCLHAQRPDTPLGFTEFYELEPIQVTGEEIPITIFARSSGDRRYATKFAHNVVEVAYETLEKSPGSGLVIIGQSGEPHPITILDRFLEISRSDESSTEVKALADELEEALSNWRDKIQFDTGDENQDEDFPVDIDSLINAFPIPLPKIAADIYLLAWQEEFEFERVEQRLTHLSSADLEKEEFEEFQWVFYLPPRNALNKVLKEVLPAVFKAEKIGPMKRVLIRGAIATFKPLIKDAMEGVRKGVLYWSVLSANQEDFNQGDIEALAEAYFESQMPRGKILPGNKKERALDAIKAQKLENEEYAKDPFVLHEPLEHFDPQAYVPMCGAFGAEGHRDKRFFLENDLIYWQEGDDDPVEYLPAENDFFSSTRKDTTLQFFADANGEFNSVELRVGRHRFDFHRLSEE
ncbi:hypothetical protein VDG1235_4740 [Verrucomicrobiia bacterium DG1235]|nr:hypothetical protein VDG1235_4740 [Verrucomicrobiae bacterium DG1235]